MQPSQPAYLVAEGQLGAFRGVHDVGVGGEDGGLTGGETGAFGHGDQQVHHLSPHRRPQAISKQASNTQFIYLFIEGL